MARTPLSGTQHALRSGDYDAVIASVGASLRSLTYKGRDLVVPFGADEVRMGYRGATLAPWPNRVVDGKYSFEGKDYWLALTEPARSHALHGLASWLSFEAIDKGPSHVTLAAVIEPQTSYPWRLVVQATFALSGDGITQTVRVRNESPDAAPWGTGPHPYLVAGSSPLDSWTLDLPASLVLQTDERLSPVALRGVDADDAERFDFRTARVIGAVEIDHAYTALGRGDDGRAVVRLTDPEGTGVEMSWDSACAWVQVHTADKGIGKPGHRAGLAVEPMTCAPDAFNAPKYDFDAGLIILEPGAGAEASWSISAI